MLRPSITLPKRRPRPGLEPVGQRGRPAGTPARRPKSRETTNFENLKVAPQSKSITICGPQESDLGGRETLSYGHSQLSEKKSNPFQIKCTPALLGTLTISRKYRPHLPRPPVRRFTSCRKRCVRPSPPCSARSREPTRSARAETGRSPRLEERPDATNRRASQDHGGDGNQAGVRRDFEF